MTAKEIFKEANQHVHGVSLENGSVLWIDNFVCDDKSEPHDVAWSRLFDANEVLAGAGLKIIESWSDNDSVGGEIVEATK